MANFAQVQFLKKAFPNWDDALPIVNRPAPPNTVPLLDLDLHLYHLRVDVPVDYDVYWSFAEALSLTSIRVPNRIAMGVEVGQAHVGTSSQAVASMSSNDEATANTSRPSAAYDAAPTPDQKSLRPKPFAMHLLPAAIRARASYIGSHLGAEESRTSDLQLPDEWTAFVQTSLGHLQHSGTLAGMVRKRAPMVCHGHLGRVQFMPDPLQVLLCVNPHKRSRKSRFTTLASVTVSTGHMGMR
uniref:Uncharacterized protein n=1 Tax=Bionectria ochroleuca TaxID=29856 RepID=A0A8H7MYC0_BIOOC